MATTQQTLAILDQIRLDLDRRIGLQLEQGLHLARVAGVELELLDRADRNAVVLHRAALG